MQKKASSPALVNQEWFKTYLKDVKTVLFTTIMRKEQIA